MSRHATVLTSVAVAVLPVLGACGEGDGAGSPNVGPAREGGTDVAARDSRTGDATSDVHATPDAVVDARLDAALGAIGSECSTDAECAGGTCLKEAARPEIVGGYCTLGPCQAGVDDDCPSGSRCVGGTGSGMRICVAECSSADDCRAGYECCSRDDAGVGGCFAPTHCLP